MQTTKSNMALSPMRLGNYIKVVGRALALEFEDFKTFFQTYQGGIKKMNELKKCVICDEEISGDVIYCFHCWRQVNERISEITAPYLKFQKNISFLAGKRF